MGGLACMPTARAQAPADSTHWFTPYTQFTHHGLAWSKADDLEVVSLFSVVSNDPRRERPFRLDLASPFVEVFCWEGRDRLDFAADPVVFLATATPLVAVSQFCSSCEPTVAVLAVALIPVWLPLLRPTGVWQPLPWAGLGVGYDSEYVFLAEDKGVTFRPFAGVQLDPGKYARLESGVQQSWMWSWKRDSRDLGPGAFVRLSVGTDWIGGGLLPEPTAPWRKADRTRPRASRAAD